MGEKSVIEQAQEATVRGIGERIRAAASAGNYDCVFERLSAADIQWLREDGFFVYEYDYREIRVSWFPAAEEQK